MSSEKEIDETGNEEVAASEHETDADLGLSSATLLALQEFALSSGVAVDNYGSVIDSVRKHFEPENKEDVFDIHYTSKDTTRDVSFQLKGIKKELGQTLDSTGLTIWRAAEHLCQFITDHPEYFIGKTVCELGAGLGLVAVLLDKLGYCYSTTIKDSEKHTKTISSSLLYTSPLMITDGDEETMKLLIENKIDNECSFDTAYLYWGEHEDFVLSNPLKFDLAIAADVIYEETQVEPLLETVSSIIKGEIHPTAAIDAAAADDAAAIIVAAVAAVADDAIAATAVAVVVAAVDNAIADNAVVVIAAIVADDDDDDDTAVAADAAAIVVAAVAATAVDNAIADNAVVVIAAIVDDDDTAVATAILYFIYLHLTLLIYVEIEDTGQFMLAFARRNVKIDLVFEAATKRGLEWKIIDDHVDGATGVEPIYMFSWKKSS